MSIPVAQDLAGVVNIELMAHGAVGVPVNEQVALMREEPRQAGFSIQLRLLRGFQGGLSLLALRSHLHCRVQANAQRF